MEPPDSSLLTLREADPRHLLGDNATMRSSRYAAMESHGIVHTETLLSQTSLVACVVGVVTVSTVGDWCQKE